MRQLPLMNSDNTIRRQYNMAFLSLESLALKWSWFFLGGGVVVFHEYLALYMQQLGLSLTQISWTSLMGVLQLSVPLFGFLGDRFRARKLIITVLLLVIFVNTMVPLFPLVVSLPTCFENPSESSMNGTSLIGTEYFDGNLASQRNISLDGSSHAFLFIRSGELDSHLFPKRVSLKTHTTVEEVKQNNFVPWLSTLYIFMVITRALFSVTECASLSLVNVAMITYLKEKRGSCGSYIMWMHISSSVSLFSVGLLASHFTLDICGVIGHGYYIAFVWAATATMLSSFALPWFKYEYLQHRVINWTEVKCVLSDIHYIFMLSLCLFLGSCCAFQMYWQFWYISELSGGPTIMGVAGLIRRPLVAVWFYLSGYLIEKVGDLKTIAVSLFLFSVSFLALSFTNIPWLVLVVDILQAAGYAFSYTGLTIHFSKPGSKASSAVILGKK